MKNILVFLLFLAGLNFTQAQSLEVSGTIVSELSEEPLAGVKLVVDNELITTTDANGSFSLFLQPGHHKIQLKMNGIDSEILVKLEKKSKDLKWIKVNPYKKNKITYD